MTLALPPPLVWLFDFSSVCLCLFFAAYVLYFFVFVCLYDAIRPLGCDVMLIKSYHIISSKCTIIRMTSPRCKPKIFDYTLCGQILNPVDSNPYLGVELTRTMSWNLHIDNTVKKANSVMGLIKRNLYDAPKNIKTLANQYIVRPTLEYSATIWDPFTQKNISKLEKVQRSAGDLYVVTTVPRHSSVTSMLQSLEWPSLQDRRKVARLANLFKIRNNDLSVTAAKKRLVPPKSKCIHPAKYKHVEARTEIYQNPYFPRTVVDWNALPPLSSRHLLHQLLRKD